MAVTMAIFQNWLVNLFCYCIVYEFITLETLRLYDVVSRANLGFPKILRIKDKNINLIQSIHCGIGIGLAKPIPPFAEVSKYAKPFFSRN